MVNELEVWLVQEPVSPWNPLTWDYGRTRPAWPKCRAGVSPR